MSRREEIRFRTEQLIYLKGEYQKLTDVHHQRSYLACRMREDIAIVQESLRTLKAIQGIPGKEQAA